MKLRLSVAMLAALSFGAVMAQDTTTDKGKLSYAMGYEIGQDITQRKLDVDLNTVIRAIQDGYAKKNPAVPEADMRAALEAMQQRLMEQAKAESSEWLRKTRPRVTSSWLPTVVSREFRPCQVVSSIA